VIYDVEFFRTITESSSSRTSKGVFLCNLKEYLPANFIAISKNNQEQRRQNPCRVSISSGASLSNFWEGILVKIILDEAGT